MVPRLPPLHTLRAFEAAARHLNFSRAAVELHLTHGAISHQMKALEAFDVTVTFCFTPKSRGKKAHHTSPPKVPEEYADFCARMVRRYAR